MNPKNVAIVVLTLATVGGASLVWRQYQELVELRGAAMNVGERGEMQRRIEALQKANRELENQLAATLGVSGDGSERSTTTTARTGRTRTGDDGQSGRDREGASSFSAVREMMAKPEVQALMAASRKAAMDQQYAALFRMLKLSPEQADKLKTLLLERQNTVQDVMSAAREQGLDPRSDRDAIRKLVTDAQNAVDTGIKSLLGESGYAQYTDFEQTLPQRNLVNQLQQRLTASDAPLNATQADQLVQILASNTGGGSSVSAEGPGFDIRLGIGRPAGPGGGPMVSASPMSGGVAITPEAVAQAQAILSPTQVAALQQLQQQQQSAQQLQQLFRNAWQQQGAQPGAGTGTGQPGAVGGGRPR